MIVGFFRGGYYTPPTVRVPRWQRAFAILNVWIPRFVLSIQTTPNQTTIPSFKAFELHPQSLLVLADASHSFFLFDTNPHSFRQSRSP